MRRRGAIALAPSSTSARSTELPRVDVIAAYVGGDDAAAQACVAAGAKGLVISGYAYNGRPPPIRSKESRKSPQSGIPVVLSNRGGQGRIPVDWNDPFYPSRQPGPAQSAESC